jgi:mannose-6-phosphate isomerase-like protein (cupin superfamily)
VVFMSTFEQSALSTIDFESLRTSAGRLFQGADHAAGDLSFFLVDSQPGRGPELHRHPYPEVFVVLEGTARFVVGSEEVETAGGRVVVAPERVWHRFTSVGPETLRMITLHPAPRVVTEWWSATS